MSIFFDTSVKLIVAFKAPSVHQKAIEAVVDSVVDVVARLIVFETFSDDPDREVTGLLREVSPGFSDGSEILHLRRLDNLDLGLVHGRGGEPSPEVQKFHSMSFVSTNVHTRGGNFNSLLEAL